MHKPWSLADVEVTPRQTKWVGNKAARLGSLKRIGVPVPVFHVLPVYTCQKYLRNQDEESRLFLENKLAALLSLFPTAGSGAQTFAVRSSARAEDSARYSFAGQFQSFLNLSSVDQVVDALYAVVQSGSAIPVQHYPGKMKNSTDMAVILQSMVQPILSGVLFTKNPLLSTNEMLIEYVAASNELLMQGRVEPFRIRLDRSTLKANVLGPSGALSKPVNQSLLTELGRIAAKIEALSGEPQDIEWAIDHQHRLWILQTRPITAAARSVHIRQDRLGREFTSYFFAERFSAPISPMGWSLIGKLIEKNAFRDPLWFLGEDQLAKESHLTDLFAGYPAVRLLVFQKLYSVIPPRFISKDKKAELELDRVSYQWWRNLWHAWPYLFTRLVCKNLDWLPFFHLHKWHVFDNICRMQLKAMDKEFCSISPYDARLQLLNKTIELSDTFLSLHRWSITFADLYYELLLKFITLFIDKENSADLAHKLLSGIANNQTVLANQQLALLATSCSDPAVASEAWDEYFSSFGHRSESLDVSVPTWAENRQSIIAFARQIRQAGNHGQSVLPFAQSEREATEKSCMIRLQEKKLWGRFQRSVFAYLLTRAQNFMLLRENQRDLWHRILAKSRIVLLHMAEQMIEQGCLRHADDIFYLTRFELTSWQQGKLNLQALVADRKKVYSEWLHPSSPIDALGEFRKKSKTLQGIAVSRGKIEGFAHIAGSYEEALSAKKDTILIARSIDPAWTPVFHLVSGMILEVGGVLSHASILAREFGVPAVTSVHNATRLIKQGDHIVLDGNSGTVYLDRNKP